VTDRSNLLPPVEAMDAPPAAAADPEIVEGVP